MLKQPKEETPVFQKIDAVQMLIVSIAGSMFAVVWLTSLDFIVNIFKPDFIQVLSILRITLASIGLCLAAVSGIKGILKLTSFFVELLEDYKKLKEFKAIKDKEKEA